VENPDIFVVFLVQALIVIQKAHDASSQATLLVALLSRSGLLPVRAALGERRVLLLENVFNYYPPKRSSYRSTSAPGQAETCPC
jgi:hypothetical protein